MVDSIDSSRCRLCFSTSNLSSADEIFPLEGVPNQTLIAMIYECTSIRVSFEQDYRCLVCSQCLRMLKQFQGFRKRCWANDRQLRLERGTGTSDDDNPLDCEEYGSIQWDDDDGNDRTAGEDGFYNQVKQQIKDYLYTKTKQIEEKTMAKLDEALRNREDGIDRHDENGSRVDWKGKYETLQKNNELLQKAFKNLKEKLKQTEQMLKSLKRESLNGIVVPAEEFGNQQEGGMFTMHPAIPEISTEFLQNLNYNSGPGEKGDRLFISKLAVAVFGVDVLVNSSVTGKPSNAHHNIPPKPPLCPEKIAAIEAKLYERVEQEVGRSNRAELLQRSGEKVVRLVVCQKSVNLRKQVQKRSLSTGGGSGNGSFAEDDPEEVPRRRNKRKAS
ncbi:AAEL002989-PA [Aedes aegypti]|uniref:AAEL002989-PA n=2 Tax=Aedes aegypti TaxID=7159 RepID=A0A1S4F3B3_AEDAE|nr:uncharacterized protein LOC5580286 [Aedes aegypti]EAT45755.1 AAEL002989-PA [Aedes aegypti]